MGCNISSKLKIVIIKNAAQEKDLEVPTEYDTKSAEKFTSVSILESLKTLGDHVRAAEKDDT